MPHDDDLEPFQGTYDWVAAFEQNPDQPVFDVPYELIWKMDDTNVSWADISPPVQEVWRD